MHQIIRSSLMGEGQGEGDRGGQRARAFPRPAGEISEGQRGHTLGNPYTATNTNTHHIHQRNQRFRQHPIPFILSIHVNPTQDNNLTPATYVVI